MEHRPLAAARARRGWNGARYDVEVYLRHRLTPSQPQAFCGSIRPPSGVTKDVALQPGDIDVKLCMAVARPLILTVTPGCMKIAADSELLVSVAALRDP